MDLCLRIFFPVFSTRWVRLSLKYISDFIPFLLSAHGGASSFREIGIH